MEVDKLAVFLDSWLSEYIAAANSTESPIICDVQPHTPLYLAIFGFGSIISAVGMVANFLLLYMFISRSAYRSYPFQTTLAWLDFNLCFLYIFCFALPKIAVNFQIAWLYIQVNTMNVHTLFLSRIVQLLIPYILIANTADKLAMMSCVTAESRRCWNTRIFVIATLFIIAVCIRIPIYYLYYVKDEPKCDFFESKVLMTIDSKYKYQQELEQFEVVIQFFHTFVSFVILCFLNTIVIQRQRDIHKSARRQSAFPATNHRDVVHEIARNEEKKLRYTVQTTIVIISSYLVCNAVNFLIYVVETFRKEWIMNEEEHDFIHAYYVATNICTCLFVLSSTIRIFIFYKYNPDLRSKLRTIWLVRVLTSCDWRRTACRTGLSNYPYTLTSTTEK